MSNAAKWTAKNQLGETAAWAGDGTCKILGFDNAAKGFGVGTEANGPAVLVEFAPRGEDHAKWQALVSPAEVEQS